MTRAPARPAPSIEVGPTIAGLDADMLATRFGTPFFVYDFDVIEGRVAALRAALPPMFELAYAVKANPSLSVVHHLGLLGVGADIASAGELELVARAGITPDRVIFTGPGKSDDELRGAVAAEVRAVTVESPGELARLESIAAAAGRRVPILLRLAVGERSRLESVRIIGDGGLGKFGMGLGDLEASARRAAASPNLELLGIHAFGASNVRDAMALVDHIAATVAIGARIAAESGVPLRLIDGGGGLGISYEEDGPALDLELLGRGLADLAHGWGADPALANLRVLLEPGRFLVGPAGAYVTRIVDRKELDGRQVAIVDGGIHHLLRPALVRQAHRLRLLRTVLEPADPTGEGRMAVAGPLCTGLDVLSSEAWLPGAKVGDLVAILDAGAYGFTESMPLFLSRTMPAELAIRGGDVELIRPRIEPREFLDRQLLPGW
jgi:diaminopimelate decarboxylase